MRGSGDTNTDLFLLVSNFRTWGKNIKLFYVRFRLNIRKIFFIQRVIGHSNRLPRK